MEQPGSTLSVKGQIINLVKAVKMLTTRNPAQRHMPSVGRIKGERCFSAVPLILLNIVTIVGKILLG